jgi:hypothetical protein
MIEENTADTTQSNEAGGEAQNNTGLVRRGQPEVEESRRSFVKDITKQIKDAKKHHKAAFDRMFADMEMARLGRDKKKTPENHYVANIIQRHVQQRVSALYAKNPRAIARRRDRLDFRIWDGKMETLMMAQQTLTMAQQSLMVNPGMEMLIMSSPEVMQAQALMQDYQQGIQQRQMLDRIAKTLEVLFTYSMQEQDPSFKAQFKQLVRRCVVTGVGFVKLGYQREMQRRPDVASKIQDITDRLSHIEQMVADLGDGATDESSGEIEELAQALKQLNSEEMVIVREGLLFDFPRSTTIIVDPKCVQLKGFLGADWVAEEFIMETDEVKRVYQVDVGHSYTGYHSTRFGNKEIGRGQKTSKGKVIVWEYYHKPTGVVYTVADGYPDFLIDPAAPNVQVERFFPFFVLAFNDIEDEEEIYPPSDVHLMRDMQDEYNRSRQGLREHRRANRPKYAAAVGALEESDKELLQSHPAHAVIELSNLQPGRPVSDVLQPIATVGVDPNLYDTNFLFEDMLRVVGSDESSFGMASNGGTATDAAIADTARSSSTSSQIDDLDDMFTEMAREAGKVLMKEMDQETVVEIVGPGAVWPEFSAEDLAEEIFLEVEAGSSGRPNRAQEIANMERLLPFLLQMPGISPVWLAKNTLKRMDDTLDLTDAVIDSAPSIMSVNRQAQIGTANAQTDPNQQGGEGGDNAPQAQGTEGGPQAFFGAPS